MGTQAVSYAVGKKAPMPKWMRVLIGFGIAAVVGGIYLWLFGVQTGMALLRGTNSERFRRFGKLRLPCRIYRFQMFPTRGFLISDMNSSCPGTMWMSRKKESSIPST